MGPAAHGGELHRIAPISAHARSQLADKRNGMDLRRVGSSVAEAPVPAGGAGLGDRSLKRTLELHEAWLLKAAGGARAMLSRATLSDVRWQGVNLAFAQLDMQLRSGRLSGTAK